MDTAMMKTTSATAKFAVIECWLMAMSQFIFQQEKFFANVAQVQKRLSANAVENGSIMMTFTITRKMMPTIVPTAMRTRRM